MSAIRSEGADRELQAQHRQARIVPLGIIAAIGTALSLGVFSVLQSWEREHRLVSFQSVAEERIEALSLAVGAGIESLQSLRTFLAISGGVTRGEFRAFTAEILARHPEIQAFGWNRYVRAPERAAVEAAVRAEGYPDFGITERSAEGEIVPAGERDFHVAVVYLEPLAGNENAFGYDIASNPTRLRAILEARDSGKAAITERITLVQERADQFGVLVLLPVYRLGADVGTVEARRAALEGFAVGVYRISDLVERSLARTPAQDAARVYLFDPSAPPGKQRLYPRHAEVESPQELTGELTLTRKITVAGRDWLVAVLPPESGFHDFTHSAPWAALVAGLLFTAVMTAYLRTVLSQRDQTERTVRQRTEELSRTNRALRENEGALTRAQAGLEQRVEERTAALRESEARFRDYAAAASDWLWEMDEELRFTHLSGRFQEITGLDERLPLGKTRWELAQVDPEHSEHWRQHCEDLAAHRPIRDFPYSRLDRQGRRRHFRVNGIPLFGPDGHFRGYRGTGRDVTAEVEAETARKLSEARFRNVVDNSPSLIVLKDLDGRFLAANRRFEEWFGLSESEVIGKTSHDMLPAEFAERYAAQDRETLECRCVTEQEITVLFADARVHSLIVTNFPVLGADGEPLGVGSIGTDVSAHREAEAQLRQAQKMEAVGQLTGGVAHDFNNLLAVVLGNLELVADRLPLDSELQDMIRKAMVAAERGASLTERLLAFSRKQALRPETIGLGQLVGGLLELLRRSLGPSIEIEVACAAGLWPCTVDPRQLENAVLNLAINARDAMPGGGRLTIECGNLALDGPAAAQAGLPPGDYVRLRVRDDGGGMAPDVVDKVFDPFFTTKEVGKGSGLGLSMVYGFVKQSGGEVTIDSAPGSGTTVTLYLPRSAASALPERGGEAERDAPSSHGEIVLMVEDDLDLQKVMKLALESLGYAVAVCDSARPALARLEAAPEVDLLLVDLMLPGDMTGEQLVREALRRRPGLPLLVMTGSNHAEAGPPEAGIEVLPKPFRIAELARAVHAALERGRLDRQAPLRSGEAVG